VPAMATRKGKFGARQNPTRQMVKSMLSQNLEHKLFNFEDAGTINSAGLVIPITQGVIEGDNINNRSGRTIVLEMIQFRFRRTLNTLTNRSAAVRAILLVDTLNQGAVPSVADVIIGGGPQGFYALENYQEGRFRILWDITETLSDNSSTLSKFTTHTFHPRHRVFYGASTNVAGANRKGSVFLLLQSSNPIDPPGYVVNVGLKFTDA
jgi:hypothetical protein